MNYIFIYFFEISLAILIERTQIFKLFYQSIKRFEEIYEQLSFYSTIF